MDNEIYTGNDFLVGMRGDGLVVMRAVIGPLSKEGALALAAWLVALADPSGERFPKVLEAVQNT